VDRHATEIMKPQEGNQQSSSETKELVVFDILRDSKCAECLQELWKGAFLFMEGGRPLCLSCADLDHLVYLPRGDTALTRHARKHSALSAVVVRFSRSRGRYERQGVLIEEAALEQAEEECRADAAERRAKRERDRLRRAEQDRDLTALMTEGIVKLFPGCPPEEARAIAAHTSVRGSGRVGRTSAGRALEVLNTYPRKILLSKREPSSAVRSPLSHFRRTIASRASTGQLVRNRSFAGAVRFVVRFGGPFTAVSIFFVPRIPTQITNNSELGTPM
jgi:hypothetical protein